MVCFQVDSEDLPLSISRETMQDQRLMANLKAGEHTPLLQQSCLRGLRGFVTFNSPKEGLFRVVQVCLRVED